MFYVSSVRCQVSRVTCQMSHVNVPFFPLFFTKCLGCHVYHIGLLVSSYAVAGWSLRQESLTSGPICALVGLEEPHDPAPACPVGCCSTTGFKLVLEIKLKFKYVNPKKHFKWQRHWKNNKICKFSILLVLPFVFYICKPNYQMITLKTQKLVPIQWHANHVTICWPKNIKRLFSHASIKYMRLTY